MDLTALMSKAVVAPKKMDLTTICLVSASSAESNINIKDVCLTTLTNNALPLTQFSKVY